MADGVCVRGTGARSRWLKPSVGYELFGLRVEEVPDLGQGDLAVSLVQTKEEDVASKATNEGPVSQQAFEGPRARAESVPSCNASHTNS